MASAAQERHRRYLRLPVLLDEKLKGVSRSTVYHWIKTREFPAPIKAGVRLSMWDESAVDAWLDQRSQES